MPQDLGQDTDFSVRDVLRGMTRRGTLIATCASLGLLAGMGVITVFKPTYQAEARVLIDDLATPYDQANITQTQQREPQIDERVIKSQMAVMESEDLALRVVETLKLSELTEFDPVARGLGVVSQILIATGFSNDPRLMTAEQRALERLSDKRTVYQVPESNVIAVKYASTNGKVAADVANTLAQTYVLSTRESKSGTNSRAREWLSGQIEELRAKVAASDAAVEKYRADKGLFRSRETTLGEQEISELNTQITLAEAASSEAKARADEIRELLARKGSVDASADVLNAPVIQRLREQQVAATRKVSELSATYLPNHPKMLAAQKEVNDVDRQIRREALKVVEGLQGQAKVAAARARSLRDSLEGLKGRETVSLQDEVKLKELERDAKANRDQLETMLARFADSNTRQNMELQPGYARIIQQAAVPANPYFPRLGPTLLLTTLVGLGLGLGLAFLLEVMNQAARLSGMAGASPSQRSGYAHAARRHAADVTDIPDLSVPPMERPPVDIARQGPPPESPFARPAPVTAPFVAPLATVPIARTMTEARKLLAEGQSESTYAQALQRLTVPVVDAVAIGKTRAIACVGVGAGHEVAVTALSLARALAAHGRKTILLDLDGHHGLIPDLLELPFAPGLADLVSGRTDFAHAIQKDHASNLQIIRRGAAQGAAADLLLNRTESITRTLAGIYEAVIVHVGEASPAALRLMRGCQAAVLIAPGQRFADLGPATESLKGQGIAQVWAIRADGFLKQAA